MELSAKAIEMVAEEIKSRGMSYDEIAEATLLSKSTISRVVTQRKASPYTIKQLVAYLEIGEKYRAVVGDEPENPSGCQLANELMGELATVRLEWQQRCKELSASYEDRITFYRDQLRNQQEERQRERDVQEKTYQNVTSHLKTQIIRLQNNNDSLVSRLVEAEKEAKESTQRAVASETAHREVERNRHQVFIFFALIVVAMAVALLVALGTDKVL